MYVYVTIMFTDVVGKNSRDSLQRTGILLVNELKPQEKQTYNRAWCNGPSPKAEEVCN
jgi:hypothetical protein